MDFLVSLALGLAAVAFVRTCVLQSQIDKLRERLEASP